MLTNTLKRLVYFARSTKKPQPIPTSPSQLPKQSPGFYHSISPTLKKIDKRFNQAQQQAIKQQQLMMKRLQQFKNAMIKDNQKRRKTKEQQLKQAEKRLKSLEIPKDLRERFRKLEEGRGSGKKEMIDLSNSQKNALQNQQQPNDQLMEMFYDQNQQSTQKTIKTAHIRGDFKTQQQAIIAKKMLFQKQDPLAQHKLKQQMMINQILKGSKSKQAQLNLPKDWKKQVQQQKKLKQQQSQLLNQKLRYQKLKQLTSQQKGLTPLQKSIQSNSQLKRLDKLSSQYNIQITPDQLWRQQYPPQLIQKALQYKNKQLNYFKQLIQGQHRHEWDAARQRGMMKVEKSDQQRRKYRRELIEKAEEEENRQLGTLVAPVQQQGLTRYKDLEYYKQQGVKQFQKIQNLNQYDIELRESAHKDLSQLTKHSNIYLSQYQDLQQYRLQRKQRYQTSTFGKYQTKLKKLSQKMNSLGIEHDFEDLALLKKEELFADKKMQQENAAYKQYLIKKEKKKHMKEELKKVHKEKLREDLNFDYQIDPVKLQKLDPVQMQQGLKKMQQIRRLKQSTILSTQFLKQKIHHTKTFKSMSQFISGYFYNKIQNPNNTITQKVQIGNIIPNRKNTVLNVFWQFHPTYVKVMEKYQFNEDDMERQKATLQKILQKQARYIASKMTEYLGLRYGPDIRFYFNQILQETKQAYNEMKKYKDQIIELTVEEYKEKGAIKTQQQQKEYRRKIQALATNNLQDLNNQKKLISKSYKKKQKLTAKLQQGKQKKAKKQSQQNQDQQNFQIKRKLSQKQLSQLTLQKIITSKVQQKKQSLFTPYVEDEELVFGQKEYLTQEMRKNVGVKKEGGKGNTTPSSSKVKMERKVKRSPVERLWDQVEKGI